MRRRKIVAVFGTALVGGAVGALMFAPHLAGAQTASPSPSTAPYSDRGGLWHDRGGPGFGGPGGGGWLEQGSDLAIAAKAIGISEADVQAALDKGQSIAAVAKAHKVDVQKVIKVLVADEQSELAAAVKAGTITQAQADQIKSGITARVTARVNGTGHCFGHDGARPGATSSPSTTGTPA